MGAATIKSDSEHRNTAVPTAEITVVYFNKLVQLLLHASSNDEFVSFI
jgi:hypothetical protein